MQNFKFPFWVALTSLGLVSGIVLIGFLALPNVVAAAAPAWMAGGGFNHAGWGGGANSLPPELQGLVDLPAADRFAHFSGVQISLKDKDNRPVTVHVTPGIATAASPTSLSIAANDGSTKTFALTATTMTRAQSSVAQGDQIVVVTLNDDTTARAVFGAGKDGFGGGSPGWRH
jgi:hypothetical protein